MHILTADCAKITDIDQDNLHMKYAAQEIDF